MSQISKKLQLTRETVKSLNVKAGVRTGDGLSWVAQGGVTSKSGGGASSRGISVGCPNPSGGLTSVITSGLPSGGVIGH